AIAGIPGHPVEGVSLHNLHVTCMGAGTREQSDTDVPEHLAKYPRADMFGTLPAYGLWCHHARDLHLSDIRLRDSSPALRHAVVCEDVSGLALDALEARQAKGGASVLSFRGVRDALVRGCRPAEETDVFLKVSGADSQFITLLANDLSKAREPVELGPGVP